MTIGGLSSFVPYNLTRCQERFILDACSARRVKVAYNPVLCKRYTMNLLDSLVILSTICLFGWVMILSEEVKELKRQLGVVARHTGLSYGLPPEELLSGERRLNDHD